MLRKKNLGAAITEENWTHELLSENWLHTFYLFTKRKLTTCYLLKLLQWRFWLCRTWVQWQVVQNGRFTPCSGRHQSLPRSNLFLAWTESPDTCHCFVCLIHCLLPDSAASDIGSVILSTSTNDFLKIVLFIFCYWALCVFIYIFFLLEYNCFLVLC